MLAGLIFATEDAADRPQLLAATLPFGGATLIEYQARLLIAAGASQILIAVARVTPELLGAAARIRKRGVAVDVVRSAAEAAAKVHPLAHVAVLADSLVTTEAILAPFTREGGDRLLVSEHDEGLERLDADALWSGLARLSAARLAEAAQLPADYDFLSTLLRVAVQQRAGQELLGNAGRASGHGVERDGRGLARRGRSVFAALTGARVTWVERWVLGPLARLALPELVARGVSPLALLGGGAAVSVLGLVAIVQGWPGTGLAAQLAAATAFLTGGMIAYLRGDDTEAGWADRALLGSAAAALLATGWASDAMRGERVGIVLALAIVAALGLGERLRPLARARRWWASAPAGPLLLLPFAVAGVPVAGLGLLALYVLATLAGGVEDARGDA